MNIGIDIDDTLAESFGYLQPYVAEFFGATLEEVRQKEYSYSHLPPDWQARYGEFAKTYFDRVVPGIPFKEDAAWGVRELHKRGHRIVIVTARNPLFYTDPYVTSRQALESGNIYYDKLICERDKGRICQEEGIHVLIDDAMENCEAVQERGISAILFDSPANRDRKVDFPRVSSWAEVLHLIDQLEENKTME